MRLRLISLALSLIIIPLPVMANIQTNSKCAKAGDIKFANNQTFICTKKGSATIWQSPAVAPAIGPTGGYIYQYVGGKQQRKAANNRWLVGDARKEVHFDPIRIAAYKSIYSLPTDPNFANIKFEFIVPSVYPKSVRPTVQLQLEKVASRFSPLLSKQELVKIILITEKDKSWVKSQLPKIVPPNEYEGALDILDFYDTKEKFFSRAGTGGGIAGYIPDKGYSFYISHTSSFATLETYWPEVPPHEFTHMLQGILAGGFRADFPDGHPEAKWQGHLIEGSANTLGMALAFENVGWYSDEMDRILKRDIQTFSTWRKMKTVNDAVAFIKAIEVRDSDQTNQFSYSAGQFVWEYFIGKHGVNKFIEFLSNIPKTSNFNENLKMTIGMDREAFYKEAGTYLLKNWQRIAD